MERASWLTVVVGALLFSAGCSPTRGEADEDVSGETSSSGTEMADTDTSTDQTRPEAPASGAGTADPDTTAGEPRPEAAVSGTEAETTTSGTQAAGSVVVDRTVNSSCSWQLTDYTLRSNTIYVANADGTWRPCGCPCGQNSTSGDGCGDVGPAGYPSHTTSGGEYPGRSGEHWAALLARVGDRIIEVGAGPRELPRGLEGPLEFRMNDGGCGDNAGSVHVTVEIAGTVP